MLNKVSQNKINTTRIEKNWGEILRVAGSLKSGKVNATELTKALQRNGQPGFESISWTHFSRDG